ncbi:uncharacterized protein TNIN_297611 [Trichonephila inaurata madagascariensis]|uniref:Uncharacterized protein n=1 Tax=Trichonephila inaurata madagascariensis TaxID=2747483 RepID=A0A8X6XLP2_9ARAC|nr:uncharacterized protein TNIN_297611 [Trichonephila inaurata madagascariensis]
MANDALFQHFLSQLFPNFYVKYKQLPVDFLDDSEEPFVAKGVLTENLFEAIAKSMFGVQSVLIASWCGRLEKDKVQMTSSAEKYISQTIMFCSALKSVISDIYERFIVVCGFVIFIGIYICYSTRMKFYQLTPQILTVFFENELKEDFKKRGGWKRLERYLLNQDYLEYYEKFCDYLNCDDMEQRIIMKNELLRFSNRRNFLHSTFYDFVGMGDQDTAVLTNRVMSSIETSLLTELASPISTTGSDFKERSISSALSKLSLEKNPAFEYSKKSKVSEKDYFDVTELPFNHSLANHLSNLKRLVGSFNLRESTGGASSGVSLYKIAFDLIMNLTCFKIKLEQAILKLDIAKIRIRNLDI